jgi:tetratricopeptide (TPR) repeat protein
MNLFLLILMFESSLVLPSRTAIENPDVASPVPQKLRKDYDKMWTRFTTAKDDAKLVKDLDKLLKKQKTFEPAWIIEAYLALYKGDDTLARTKFMQALMLNPNNRIAVYYLAELADAHGEYARAATLYAQLLSLGANAPEIETKRQKAFLLATDNLLRAAVRAEGENRLTEAEDYYRQAMQLAPNEPTLHAQLADLLNRQNKNQEAEAEKKTAEGLMPRNTAARRTTEDVKGENLEDLGRWGSDIEIFRQIRNAEAATREQVAVLIIRYFPQVTELRQSSQIITDIQASPAKSEIQTVAGLGLMDPLPNHAFEPAAPITRGELAKTLARLSRLIGVSGNQATSVVAADVGPTNALYQDVQLVLGSGLMTLEDAGAFDVSGRVSGGQAVRAIERLLRSFQQERR